MDTKQRILNYICSWENKGYGNGIPDEAPFRLEQLGKVPSYKLICKSILSNDIYLERLGYSKPQCAVYRNIKKAELIMRGKIKESIQLSLWNERI